MKLTVKIILFLAIVAVFPDLSRSQPLPDLIYLDTSVTNVPGSKSFYVKNPAGELLQITNIRTLSSKFYFTINTLNINPYDSVLVTVYFKTNQNITYRDFLIFENKTLNYPIVFYSLATAKYPDTIYKFTQGLIDEGLKTVLRTFCTNGYVSLGYNTARDKMFETIDDYGYDTIECVYSGRKIKAVNRTEAQNQNFNTEHTFPQSFFNSNEPMVSDLYHLYPTDAAANNARSNYPFGFVVSNITWQQGGSKLGKDYENQTVFEVRDYYKGNISRTLFYFSVKYQNPENFVNAKQENVLRQWDKSDTTDARERLRNDRVSTFQKIRNPFIDHPEFIDRIKSTYSVSPTIPAPDISASPFNVVFDTLKANDTSSYYIAVMNYGTGNLNLNSVSSSIPQFVVESYPTIVPQSELRYIKVRFHPTAINQTYNGILTIQNSDSTITVNLKGFSNSQVGITQISAEVPQKFSLYQNYPNPFNPLTKIKFDIAQSSPSIPLQRGTLVGQAFLPVILEVFDITGREVTKLVNETLQPGTYEVEFNAENLTGGIYFYRLTSGDFSSVKKAILLK